MADSFDPIDRARANMILESLLETPFSEDDEHLQFALRQGDLTFEGDFELEPNDVIIVVGNLTVTGCLADQFYNEDDFSKLYVMGNLRARDMVCGSEVRVTGNLEVQNVLYANSFDMDTLGVSGKLSAKVFIEDGHQVEFGALDVGALISDDETWREVKPEAVIGGFETVLQSHVLSEDGQLVLGESLHQELKAGRSVLR
ncbi:hypothetical protein FJV41_18925 [Myxococcus llanfairpwllgwyngyllgogerychwyrndrobwllllantysiliogogogochensis]|uniref:Polymer-forming cytoskeletal protein n=1 Tax=Myxococcus llanfairpwllgwyngyllgogerychwyrndrobwllllantysiliogogogochensis TaxID=2590453 RepID=A0A540WZJ4_9BACT|nr:hypothetical protein [Myxococcus llanfairpwllgwyngyllgogerychwyrndrobwllllantysiliogogogochensis]TQF14373.1 hypothetical protein FJV41_18925 [Myxococcus llanfairpwllgwyngyllgogerychwyrndrobwllllantysiliogogogochensis]